MTDKLILWELQNLHDALTQVKDDKIFNLRKKRPSEGFNFIESILNTTNQL